MHPFCCYSSSENINCHSIQDFYYYSQFYMATFQTATHVRKQHLMHIYLFGVSINSMLILQLKIFLSVNLCFHFDSLCNLAFISQFNAVDVHIIQMFNIFIACNPSDICPTSSKNRILNETLTYQKLNIIKIIYYLSSLFRVKFYLPMI